MNCEWRKASAGFRDSSIPFELFLIGFDESVAPHCEEEIEKISSAGKMVDDLLSAPSN